MKLLCVILVSSALALPSEYFHVNITPADKAFLTMMKDMANDLIFLHEKNWRKGILSIQPGDIVFIKEKLETLLFYFKGRDYERFPYMWKEFHIYRKRGTSA